MRTLWKNLIPDSEARNRPVAAFWLLVLLLLALCATPGRAAQRQTASGPVSVEAMATGLDTPWGLAFLPGGAFLVTERGGALYHFDSGGRKTKVSGVPEVYAWGQGGLLDVVAARDYPESREIFLTFSKRYRFGGGTALAVAALSPDNRSLNNLRVIFEMASPSRGGRHFGSRVVEAPDGTLFLTLGERGDSDTAQDLSLHHGKTIRIRRDGSIPRDNPFVGQAGGAPGNLVPGPQERAGCGARRDRRALGRRAWRAGRRRDQPGQEGPELRMAGHRLRPPLFGRKNRRRRRKRGHGTAGFLLGPLYRALGHGDLFGAALAGLARAVLCRFPEIRLYLPSGPGRRF